MSEVIMPNEAANAFKARIIARREAKAAMVKAISETHTLFPVSHAEYIVGMYFDSEIPFCKECADFHFDHEEHSMAYKA